MDTAQIRLTGGQPLVHTVIRPCALPCRDEWSRLTLFDTIDPTSRWLAMSVPMDALVSSCPLAGRGEAFGAVDRSIPSLLLLHAFQFWYRIKRACAAVAVD